MTADILETWRTRHGDVVEIYRARDGFRYRVKARNGENVEQGSEPYTRQADAVEAATRHHPVIDDLTPEAAVHLERAIATVTDELMERAIAAQHTAGGHGASEGDPSL